MASAEIAPTTIMLPVEGRKDMKTVLFKHPKSIMGVVVLQEWWGMNEQIQAEAAEIAKDGNFTTMVPDLYRGKVAIDRETAGHLMTNLDWPGAIKDIRGCVKYLLTNGCTKVGVTGFCMGGALSMASAGLIPEVSAAAPFYGICKDDVLHPKDIKRPIQFHFGLKDEVVGLSDITAQETLKEKLAEGNVSNEFYQYDAGHAFTNKTAVNYSVETTEIALKRVYDFFHKHLA